jgi:succinyl-CoA synthetase beta subunit
VATRSLFAAAGIPFVAQRTVTSAPEAVAAARELGYPVVLKALGLLHKSDAGGVVLGLTDDAAVQSAHHDLQARLAPQTCSVEAMAPLSAGVELLIGTRWDARFGPLVLAGSGGIYTEILRDTAAALAPVGEDEAEAMLRSLKAAPLLTGIRGRPPTDLRAAARALAALSRVAAAHPELAELEINPLLITPAGALALDARAVPATPPVPATSPTQEPTECSSPTPQSSSRSASVPAD